MWRSSYNNIIKYNLFDEYIINATATTNTCMYFIIKYNLFDEYIINATTTTNTCMYFIIKYNLFDEYIINATTTTRTCMYCWLQGLLYGSSEECNLHKERDDAACLDLPINRLWYVLFGLYFSGMLFLGCIFIPNFQSVIDGIHYLRGKFCK